MTLTLQSLDIDRIRSATKDFTIGRYIVYVPAVDSTNRLARELDITDGGAVITDYQEAGRGRRGRSWSAPPNSSLLLSVILPIAAGALQGDVVTVAALAVADAIRSETGLAVDLKWPNDILSRGRKVCGILAERDSASERIVVGIGLNVNFIPDPGDPLFTSATTLQSELGRVIDRESLAIALFSFLNLWYRMLTERADTVHATWSARLAIVGRSLEVHDVSGVWSGVAVALQRDGALLVRDECGEMRTLYAADVSIRTADAGSVSGRAADQCPQ